MESICILAEFNNILPSIVLSLLADLTVLPPNIPLPLLLLQYFMDECLQKLVDVIDSGELQLQDLVPSERIAKLVKVRLLMQAPYISKWPQALSIQVSYRYISIFRFILFSGSL